MFSRRYVCRSLLALLIVCLGSPAMGDETLVLTVIVNHVEKGVLFAKKTESGDFLILLEDLKEMGFLKPGGEPYEIDGETYVSLRSMQGVEFSFDEINLSLHITAKPYHFKKNVIDLIPPRPSDVYFPTDTSAFLNYSLSYTDDSSGSPLMEFTKQVGARHRNTLFLTDSVYTKDEDGDRFVRLLSQAVYDRREDFRRVIVGDFFAFSGETGTTLTLGGLSYQKAFLLDPHFLQNPTLDLSGAVSLPTKAEIYLNGTLIRQEDLAPGEFELKNLMTQTGAGFVEVVLTDPFGNQQRLINPAYLSTRLLKTGLHEYSYNLGFLREDLGEKSFEYGDLVLSAFHRYGVNDRFTLNFSGETAFDRYRLGSSASYRLQHQGMIGSSFSNSRTQEGQTGWVGSLQYEYQSRTFNVYLLTSFYTKEFATVLPEEILQMRKYELSAGTAFNTARLGSMGVNYLKRTHYEDPTEDIVTLGFSRHLTREVSFLSRFRWIREDATTYEFVAGIQYTPGESVSASARYQNVDGESTETVQVQKSPPVGEGVGGRALYERNDSNHIVDSFLQYNARYGNYAGRFRSVSESDVYTYQVSASGAVAYVDNTAGLTRPIRDSFGLVQVADIEGVTVSYNSRDVGKTDSSGKLFVPELSSFFDNQISIDDRDIPLDYTIPKVRMFVSPPLRSGTHIRFDADRFQAVTGRLRLKTGTEIRPVGLYEIKISVDDRMITFQTDRTGEFYLENIKPGSYKASFEFEGKTCIFDVIIPVSKDVIIDLGELTCEPDS